MKQGKHCANYSRTVRMAITQKRAEKGGGGGWARYRLARKPGKQRVEPGRGRRGALVRVATYNVRTLAEKAGSCWGYDENVLHEVISPGISLMGLH